MTATQAWLLIGIPVLLVGVTLYTLRSPRLSAAGVLVLVAGTVVMAAADRISAAVLGVIAVLLYAAGQAGQGAATGADPVARRPHGQPALERTRGTSAE